MFIAEITNDETIEFDNKISQNVRKLRKEKNLTQLDISLALGFNNPSFITNAESLNNDKRFNLTQLHKLSVVLDIDMCEFFK